MVKEKEYYNFRSFRHWLCSINIKTKKMFFSLLSTKQLTSPSNAHSKNLFHKSWTQITEQLHCLSRVCLCIYPKLIYVAALSTGKCKLFQSHGRRKRIMLSRVWGCNRKKQPAMKPTLGLWCRSISATGMIGRGFG